MVINITGNNFELTTAIKNYIQAKAASLQKQHIEIGQIDVEVDKNKHHKQGDVFHVRMNVSVPQKLLHVEENKDDLYAAVDVCRDEAERQLRKYKTKFEARHRRSQKIRRSLKSIFRVQS